MTAINEKESAESGQSEQTHEVGQKDSNLSAVPKNQKAKRYLIFKLGEYQYAVQLVFVKEVVGMPALVQVPNSPPYLIGLFNLRGKIIGAVDLKAKLKSKNQTSQVKRPVLILTECYSTTVGFCVDSITEVLSINPDQIETKIELDLGITDEAFSGVARFADRPLILVLDLKKVLNKSDYSQVDKLNSKAA